MLNKCLSDGKDEEYCATLFEDVLNCIRENKPLTNLPHLIDYVGNKEIVIEALKQHIDLDYIRGDLSQKYEDAEKELDKYLDKA